MQTITTEILIIGAGPGGMAAALTLAQQGIPSIVLDKAGFPRDKICGDACSGKVVEFLRKIDERYVQDIFRQRFQVGSHGVCFVAPNEKMLRVPFATKRKLEHAPGFISKRIDFDYYLFNKALDHPLITVLPNHEAQSFTQTPEGWKVMANNSEFHTKLLIDASGAHSPFARHHAGIIQDDRHYCAGLRAYYKGVEGMDKENYIELHFIQKFLPGYFWIFPLPDGMANVGVGLRSDVISKKRIHLKKEMMQIIKSHPQISKRFNNAEMVDGIKGWGLPLGSMKRSISGGHYMLVGDAASLIDPFTGEGIGNAMLSGWVAAQTAQKAISEKNYSASFLQQYDKEVYRRLWQELSLSRRLQQLAAYPALFNWIVKKANRNKTFSEMISCMFEDIDLRSRLKQPSFYLKLLFN